MSKRKGLSLEEKRQKMLELFHEKNDFYTLKELEKIAPKEKGIVSQSVKDVVQSLVDDGVVDTDKIGTSIFFWAFPTKAIHTKKREIEELETKLREIEAQDKALDEFLKKYSVGREDTPERRELLARIESLEKERDQLTVELKRYEENDPKVIAELEKELAVATEAVNRWTDNIFALKKWCMTKFFMEESVLNKQMGIDDDLDYVE